MTLTECIASQSEVIWAIVSLCSPCLGCHLLQLRVAGCAGAGDELRGDHKSEAIRAVFVVGGRAFDHDPRQFGPSIDGDGGGGDI